MSATINGTAVNFGFTGSLGMACTALKGVLQNADQSAEADKEEVRSGVGDIIVRAWYDQHYKVNLEFVISVATGIADTVTATTLANLTPGVIISITACASMPDLVATTWEVQSGAKIVGSNTTSKRLSVPLEKRAGITGVATS